MAERGSDGLVDLGSLRKNNERAIAEATRAMQERTMLSVCLKACMVRLGEDSVRITLEEVQNVIDRQIVLCPAPANPDEVIVEFVKGSEPDSDN